MIRAAVLCVLLCLPPAMAQAARCAPSGKGITGPAPSYPAGVHREARWEEAFGDVFEVLCRNLKTPNFLFPGYRAHPGPSYHGAYLWDSAFISQIWMHWDPKIAQELVHWILRFQREDGLLPHVISEVAVVAYRANDSQPPILAWASWRIFEKSRDKNFLSRIYPGLKKYHEFLLRERRHPDGLFFWLTPYESGIDNSPRFSNRDESWYDDTRKLASVDMSSYVALSMQALGRMASELGLQEDEERFAREFRELRDLVNQRLWDPVQQSYQDWDYRTGAFVRVRTISDLTPLVAGIPDPERAKLLLRDILDPQRYNTLIPFPSVARDEPSFVKDMWQGPVWINMAYLAVLGLQRYGYEREASDFAQRLVRGVFETWMKLGLFYEFYDPERTDLEELTRKKGNFWKRITLGTKPVRDLVGWTGLTNALIFEFGENWRP